MSDIVASLIETLNTHPELGGIITFIISAGESVAIIGTIVPGSITMTAIGALAGAGIIPLWSTLFWATLGAIVGDGISYWIGHHFKDRLHRVWPFRKHPALLKTGEVFFHKHGGMSVFIGRFVGPVRALVPLVAGMLGMRPLIFYLANITSAILWAPFYMLPGILLGAASLELPPDIAMHVIMVLIFIVLLTLLFLWFLYKTFQLIHLQTDQLKNHIWRKLKKSRYFSVATVILKHHDTRKTHGQLRLALFFILTSLVFLAVLAYSKWNGAANIMINEVFYHFARGVRSDYLDYIMRNITLFGQKDVVLPAVLIVCVYFLYSKRFWTALHVLLLGVLGAGAIFVIKNVVQSTRPWGITNASDNFSFPSGHTTLATLAFVGLAFLIAASFHPKRRFPFYITAMLLAITVGMSRIYLGAHWFTDVLAGWFLSLAILIVVIISFRRREEKLVNPLGTFLVSILALAFTFSVYHYTHREQFNTSYTQLDWPRVEITKNDWWDKKNSIPNYRVSLFGFPSQRINIEWIGNLEDIKKILLKQGWENPPERNWITSLHRIADISSAQYLPLVSPQYLDKQPSLILTREINNSKDPEKKHLVVLRLWDSHRIIAETKQPLWVGVVGIVPRTYSWLSRKHPVDVSGEPGAIFPVKLPKQSLEWKTISIERTYHNNKTSTQTIILIRDKKGSSNVKRSN